jgi:hypothetical protein
MPVATASISSHYRGDEADLEQEVSEFNLGPDEQNSKSKRLKAERYVR